MKYNNLNYEIEIIKKINMSKLNLLNTIILLNYEITSIIFLGFIWFWKVVRFWFLNNLQFKIVCGFQNWMIELSLANLGLIIWGSSKWEEIRNSFCGLIVNLWSFLLSIFFNLSTKFFTDQSKLLWLGFDLFTLIQHDQSHFFHQIWHINYFLLDYSTEI